MLPTYKPGDLVLAVRMGIPKLGDVVAYRDPGTSAIFIHRIVDTTPDGRLILKGDNNDFSDTYQPLPSEIMGRAVLRIPRIGNAIVTARSPLLLAGTAAALLGLSLVPPPKRRHRLPRTAPPGHLHLLPAASICGMLLAGSGAALTIWAFTLPPQVYEPAPINYRHTGSWQYHADTIGSPWDAGNAQTGDPLFWKLNDRVIFSFHYSLSADEPLDAHGHGRLVAFIGAPTYGWRRTVNMSSRQDIEGGTATLTGAISLHDLWTLAQTIQAEAGLPASSLLLEIGAEIEMDIRYGETIITDRFAPSLSFQADAAALRPTLQASPSGPSPLTPFRAGSLPRTIGRTGTLPTPLDAIPVPAARAAGLVALCAGLTIALICLANFLLLDPFSRRLIITPNAVPVERLPTGLPRAVASSRRHLLATAQRMGLPILMTRSGEMAVPIEGVLIVWNTQMMAGDRHPTGLAPTLSPEGDCQAVQAQAGAPPAHQNSPTNHLS